MLALLAKIFHAANRLIVGGFTSAARRGAPLR